MKSFIFCTSYIRSEKEKAKRYEKWINYYRNLPFSSDKPMFVIDDGSDEKYLDGLGDHRVNEGDDVWPVAKNEATV